MMTTHREQVDNEETPLISSATDEPLVAAEQSSTLSVIQALYANRKQLFLNTNIFLSASFIAASLYYLGDMLFTAGQYFFKKTVCDGDEATCIEWDVLAEYPVRDFPIPDFCGRMEGQYGPDFCLNLSKRGCDDLHYLLPITITAAAVTVAACIINTYLLSCMREEAAHLAHIEVVNDGESAAELSVDALPLPAAIEAICTIKMGNGLK